MSHCFHPSFQLDDLPSSPSILLCQKPDRVSFPSHLHQPLLSEPQKIPISNNYHPTPCSPLLPLKMCYYQRILHTCGHLFHSALLVRPCEHARTPQCRPRHLLERSKNARKCPKCTTPEDIADRRANLLSRRAARTKRAMRRQGQL